MVPKMHIFSFTVSVGIFLNEIFQPLFTSRRKSCLHGSTEKCCWIIRKVVVLALNIFLKHERYWFCRVNLPCPKNFNPADHYIRTLAMVPGKEKECKKRIKVKIKSILVYTIKNLHFRIKSKALLLS